MCSVDKTHFPPARSAHSSFPTIEYSISEERDREKFFFGHFHDNEITTFFHFTYRLLPTSLSSVLNTDIQATININFYTR